MAIVPQKHILTIPFHTFEPPAFAATIPQRAKKTIEKIYWQITIFFIGAKIATNNARHPPERKEAPDAMAA